MRCCRILKSGKHTINLGIRLLNKGLPAADHLEDLIHLKAVVMALLATRIPREIHKDLTLVDFLTLLKSLSSSLEARLLFVLRDVGLFIRYELLLQRQYKVFRSEWK